MQPTSVSFLKRWSISNDKGGTFTFMRQSHQSFVEANKRFLDDLRKDTDINTLIFFLNKDELHREGKFGNCK